MPTADPEINSQFGDFRIEERLGAGGMGVVYRARQVSLNRVVALKVLGNALDSAVAIARFRREAQAVARLEHPSIASVYFIGQDDKSCYMAMAYVDGVSLREVIRRVEAAAEGITSLDEAVWGDHPATIAAPAVRFDTITDDQPPAPDLTCNDQSLRAGAAKLIGSAGYCKRCAEIARDVGAALAYAHEKGVIHRDVKPENVLFGRDGKVTVVDFGIARFYEDETLTYTGQLVGTPLYMSPEQIIGQRDVDERTDVYSLGVVLFELLSLQKPFQAANREGLFRQILTRQPVPVNWKNPGVPSELAAVVHHALAKDPGQRYGSMADCVADVNRFLEGSPVKAPPYRYRSDDKEIAARRPSEIMYLGFFSFAIGLFSSFSFLLIVALNFTEAFQSNRQFLAVILLTSGLGLVGAVEFTIGWLILNGRPAGRWLGLAFGVLCLCLAPAMAVASVFVYGVWKELWPFAIGATCAGLAFVATLTRPRVTRWFEFAKECRAEYRRQVRGAGGVGPDDTSRAAAVTRGTARRG